MSPGALLPLLEIDSQPLSLHGWLTCRNLAKERRTLWLFEAIGTQEDNEDNDECNNLNDLTNDE